MMIQATAKLLPPCLPRLCGPLALAVLLSGCASISVPFASLSGKHDEPQHTASSSAPAGPLISTPSLPPELSSVNPVVTPVPASAGAQPTDMPTRDLIASMPDPATAPVSLTQSDLNAMGRALTDALRADRNAGTLAWSHGETGRAGAMTPFRPAPGGTRLCRMVSVEITDGPRDVILLADACEQGGNWVFITPLAGQAL
jgi:hypothetical protein